MQFTSCQWAACFSPQLWLSKNLLHQWVQPAKGAVPTPPNKPGFTPYGDFSGSDWFPAKVIVISHWARLEWALPQIRWTYKQSVGNVCFQIRNCQIHKSVQSCFPDWCVCAWFPWSLITTALRKILPNAADARVQMICLTLGVGDLRWEWIPRRSEAHLSQAMLRPSTAKESRF